MRLAHLEVRSAGFVVHAWSTPRGVAAIRLGEVPAVAAEPGGRPVRGIDIGGGDPRLEELGTALQAYFAGGPLEWAGDLDWASVTVFQRDVYEAVGRVAHGQTTTYRHVARGIGRPQAVRAVGNALHRNPFPLVVPCHRILREGGGLGGYAGGPAVKRRLIALHGYVFPVIYVLVFIFLRREDEI